MSAIITVAKSPWLPPLLYRMAFGFSAFLSVILALATGIGGLRDGEGPLVVITFGGLSAVLGSIAFVLWSERRKRRDDRDEVTSDGLRCIRRGKSNLVSWEEIENVAVFRAMYQGVECPSVRIKLRNGKTLRIAAPTGVAGQISLNTSQAVLDFANAVRTVTREARQERFERQIEAGDVVRCDGISVSRRGITVGKQELPWTDIGRIRRTSTGNAPNGAPRILIFHKTLRPERPWKSVPEGRIWDADVVLPFCMQQLRENGVEDQHAYPSTIPNSQPDSPLGSRLVALLVFTMGTLIGSYGYLEYAKVARCTWETTATLDPTYKVVKTTRKGRTSTSYFVTYTFYVDGEAFRGSDSLPLEPDDIETTVYFNPDNPEENLLVPSTFWLVCAIGFGVCMAAVGVYLMYDSFQKPQGKKPSRATGKASPQSSE